MAETLEQYLNARQVAQALGLSYTAVFKLAQEGILPHGVKIGRSRRWSIKDIQAALQDMQGGMS